MVYVPEKDHPPVSTLLGLLEQEDLKKLSQILASETLESCVEMLTSSKQVLLEHLKQLGLKLKDRQDLANALSCAKREGRLLLNQTPPEPVADISARLSSMSVRQLRELIVSAGLEHDDCVEKPQLVERACEAQEVHGVGSKMADLMGKISK